jgi:two-component system response regulator FixJ
VIRAGSFPRISIARSLDGPALDAHRMGDADERSFRVSDPLGAATLSDEPVVFVVDDDAEVRRSVRELIEPVGLAVRTCANAHEFLDSMGDDPFGCLVLDVRLPGMSGLQLLEELRRRGLNLPAIVLTGQPDVKVAVRALKIGAFDVLEKPVGDQPLLDLVNEAIERSHRMREELAERTRARGLVHALSPRERDVLKLLVSGKANKEIADELGLSTRTVEGHRGRLADKLRVGSLAEMVRLAILAEDRGDAF